MSLTDEIHKKSINNLTDREWKILIAEDEISTSFFNKSRDLANELRRMLFRIERLKDKIETTILGTTFDSKLRIFSASWLSLMFFTIKDIKIRESYMETSYGLVSRDLMSLCSGMINPQMPNSGLPFSNKDLYQLYTFIQKTTAQEQDLLKRTWLIVNKCFEYIGLTEEYIKLSGDIDIYALAAEIITAHLREFHSSLVASLNKHKINE